jgi:predicted RNase H-like HicB family nuclease
MTTENRYEIDIYWSDSDGFYVAEVPELPGCVADGGTHAEALDAAQEAIKVWIDAACRLGRSVPVPREREARR